MNACVLVVEDEADIRRILTYNLGTAGYRVMTASTGQEALELAPNADLVLLDVMLPDLAGTEICRRLKAAILTLDTPIIMVTARGEEADRIQGLALGADDYVVKPFSVPELLLRVRARLRRAEAPSVHELGRLRMDTGAHRTWVDGRETELTAMEFRLLLTLWERRNRVQSRETLLDSVWGLEAEVGPRAVDTHIKRLRDKLGPAGDYIETVRGVGYRFSQGQ
ncbi:MAG: response regulator transcription factor [Armatimonadetes bacterium]|nr:response regulator transcription factor [Armatimonadota bacterium]